mmetsp:Transcript_25401/g.70713  ORF Transcript_25401/g.70713 Transcript_25401/m.70713 type:complete len:993 (-) Transcript_25401:82-3060(-)
MLVRVPAAPAAALAGSLPCRRATQAPALVRSWHKGHVSRDGGCCWPPRAAAGLRPSLTPMGARGFGIKARNWGNTYVPRKEWRKTLFKAATRKNPDPTLLLPPFISAWELRGIFRMNYAAAFRTLKVTKMQSKYYWKDLEGRHFESASKRKVMVPFEMALIPCQDLGLMPTLLDPEPDWDPAHVGAAAAVPVVAVLGHINHGKTTLLDALCGTAVAQSEPGGITQDVRAITGQLRRNAADFDPMLPLDQQPLMSIGVRETNVQDQDASAFRFDTQRVTLLDTPGHEAFELHRGRTMAAADVAVVVVSVERGAEVQTEEVLQHAAKWSVPVVFALNKIDLPEAHVELTRAELRRQCQRLFEQGVVDIDWTREAEAAVPISALRGMNLEALVARVQKTLAALPSVPLQQVESQTRTPGLAKKYKHIARRTDILTGVDLQPSAVALVLEYDRGAEEGDHVLTLIVRSGKLVQGQHFVVGTVFGLIRELAIADGTPRSWTPCEVATAGVAVQLKGLKMHFGGDCSTDDLLFTFPRERAWRLREYRSRLEALMAVQTEGPSIEVPWEHDPHGRGGRTQVAFKRSVQSQPEFQPDANPYARRMQQRAIQQLVAAAGDGAGRRTPPDDDIFTTASRGEYSAPLRDAAADWRGGPGEEAEGGEDKEIPVAGARGRRSARRGGSIIGDDGEPIRRGAPSKFESRFAVIGPSDGGQSGEETAHAAAEDRATAGRRSRRGGHSANDADVGAGLRAASGAWTARARGPGTPTEDFLYYTGRETWTEEADIDSARVRARWQDRDMARWTEEERQVEFREKEKALKKRVRHEVFGEPLSSEDEDDDEKVSGVGGAEDRHRNEEDEEEVIPPMPRRNIPVLPLILKTRNVSQFDVLMDEVERLQQECGVRVVVVHGGLGPVIPKDVVHAEVEKHYGNCPIYAFQVGVHPVAEGQAKKIGIDVYKFAVFTDLVGHVASRCNGIWDRVAAEAYAESVKPARRHSAAPHG